MKSDKLLFKYNNFDFLGLENRNLLNCDHLEMDLKTFMMNCVDHFVTKDSVSMVLMSVLVPFIKNLHETHSSNDELCLSLSKM